MKDQNKIAIITGGGSGIGRASALALYRAGFHIVLAGRKLAPLEETAHDGAGLDVNSTERGQFLCVATDVSNENAVNALFGAARKKFGRVDVLFNNAGLFLPGAPVDEVTVADWRAVVDVNLTGAFLCAREAFRVMKAQEPCGGRIINNGSIAAHVPRPHSISYTATKHAISGLTKALSLDGRQYNIACGQIDIGNAATQLVENIQHGALQGDGRIVPEPVMDVRHCAEAVVYMASLPLDANVQSMTVMATKMPFIGRG